jgi:fused signal recognition particle receptor
MMIHWMSPEILLGAGAALTISFGFTYFFFFKGKKPAEKPTQKAMELEELRKEVAEKPKEKFKSLHDALSETRQSFWGRIAKSMTGGKVDRSQLDAIEEVLYTSDLGPKTVQRLFTTLENKATSDMNGDNLKETLRTEMMGIFSGVENGASDAFKLIEGELTVWMVVGVNGAGKTTTIGKLASQLQQKGKKVMIAAGDTFRAAADAQLRVWSERAQVEIFSPENVKDPSAVAYDAVNKAKAKGFDVVIIDTAGRLHTQVNLMEELKKVKRVVQKVSPTGPHEIILVLDANSGQNALVQAEQFHQALQVTGVILTKMDGSAKGGVAIGIACDVGLPVKMIGVGEAVEDLRPFSPSDFVNSIL